MTLVLGLLKGVWSKAGAYMIGAAGIALAVLSTLAYVTNAAKTHERLQGANAKLKDIERNNKVEADIAALSDADARRKLRERWGKH